MKKNSVKIWAIYLLAAGSLMACGTQDIQTGNLNVIPLPQEIVETPSAAPFVINSSTTICYEEGNEKLAGTARMLAGYIKEVTGTEVKIGTKAGKNCIILKVDPSITHKEGYELNVSVDVITLTGATEAGVFYGCQTIHKALPITDGKALASLPAGTVKDFPQYNYRGFMIDVGRHFFPKEYLKELIDVMALHNINYFHWHLTEDQGWRIEIKKYPKLTEVGSYRKETITAPGSGKFDGTPVSGYYTQEDAKEIVAYAAERFITVIPEIDMPGHMLAALASYPELGCTGGPYETATKFGVFKEVLCGGNPQTLQFAKDVVNELMDIFPDAPYIHIGGDECPKAEWMKCPKCQAKIKELGLHDTEEHSKENQLQVYFMNEVEKEIAKRGKKMLAWDEILEGNPNPETTTVMAWTGIKASVKAAQLGHSTIVCPISHLYFSNPGYNRLKGISSVERVYMFEPQSEKLTPEEKKNIIGVQGCIWTEWTKDSVKMEWQMMPRIAALSELQWCNPERKDLNGFLKRLRHQMDLYELYGYHYKEDIEDVTISVKPKGQDGIAVVELNTFDNASVYYTLDGSEPTSESLRYTEPFMINRTTTIKARAIRNGRESNVTEETLTYNLATMHSITQLKLMDMKTKIIITAMLLTTAYVLLVNLMFLSGFGKDEMVKVGWYSEFGGNSTTTLYPLYVWLNFPYTVCFYFFTTLFFAKVKVHVNKWLGETAFVLWCVSLVPILVNTVYDLYMVSSFDGDEMYRSLENYWETEGKSDYPFMWLLLSSRVGNNWNWMNDLNYYGNWALWAAFLAFAIVFALLFKKDKVLGIAGATVMVVSILLNMFPLPCGYIAIDLCWIALCAAVLWRLRQSSFDKPFVLP